MAERNAEEEAVSASLPATENSRKSLESVGFFWKGVGLGKIGVLVVGREMNLYSHQIREYFNQAIAAFHDIGI